MTDKKISELTSITGADVSDAEDVLPIVDTSGATTKKITRAELFQSVSALDVDGNITVGGTVDGRDIASDGTKLDSALQPGEAVPQTSSTGSAEIPAGTDAERDGTPSAGYFRFNTDSGNFEGYDGTSWGEIGGGGSGDLSAVAQDIIPDADSTRDIGSTSKRWAQGWFDDVTAGTADINGGTIDGTVIGGSTSAAISGTTGNFSGNLTVDTNTLFVDAANNRVGIGTSSPAAALDVNGQILALSGAGTADRQIEIGVGRTGNGNSYIDLISDTTYADYGARFIRYSNGANAATRLDHRGTGALSLWSTDAGTLQFGTNNAEHMRITPAGSVGIGTSIPSEKLSVTGNVTISGSLSKGSGSFKIDHPIKPDTHHLVHSFIEGPQADNLYRGKVDLVSGQAIINLDEAGRMTEGTFVALNGNVQCFTTNEDGWTAVRGKINGNILTIEAQDAASTDTVSWLVIGERHDQHMIDANWTDEHGRVITELEKGAAS